MSIINNYFIGVVAVAIVFVVLVVMLRRMKKGTGNEAISTVNNRTPDENNVQAMFGVSNPYSRYGICMLYPCLYAFFILNFT